MVGDSTTVVKVVIVIVVVVLKAVVMEAVLLSSSGNSCTIVIVVILVVVRQSHLRDSEICVLGPLIGHHIEMWIHWIGSFPTTRQIQHYLLPEIIDM